MKQDMILILDLGSEENPRLAREIRDLGVYSEIYPHDISPEELKALPGVRGIILNGGPNCIVDGVEIDAGDHVYNGPVPVLLAGVKGKHPWPAEPVERKAALSRFVFDTCGAKANWNMENFIADQVELIRRQVGDKQVLLALSGGVDSSVVAALLIKAIGKQLTCVHVNHGLLRKGEPEQVVEVFGKQLDANLVYVDAADRFLDKLAGVADPEQKRKIIGAEFIRVFEEEARKLSGIQFLAQGTIYPDIIESGTKTVKAVKSHHNVGGLPEDSGLYDCVRDAMAAGKSVVLTTQVENEGSDLGVYHVGHALKNDLGVLEAYDMTTEAVVAKLMWILGQTQCRDEAARLFYTPVAQDILWPAG